MRQRYQMVDGVTESSLLELKEKKKLYSIFKSVLTRCVWAVGEGVCVCVCVCVCSLHYFKMSHNVCYDVITCTCCCTEGLLACI